MELDAVDGVVAVADGHHHAAVGVRGDVQYIGHGLGRGAQRVVADRRERTRQTFKDARPVVVDLRGFAMHQLGSARDHAAEGFGDRLVSKAHTENRDRRSQRADELYRDPRVARHAGAWRDHDEVRRQRTDLFDAGDIVPNNSHQRPELAQVLVQVVGKAVVVVDQQHARRAHATTSSFTVAGRPSMRSASATAASVAFALLIVS